MVTKSSKKSGSTPSISRPSDEEIAAWETHVGRLSAEEAQAAGEASPTCEFYDIEAFATASAEDGSAQNVAMLQAGDTLQLVATPEGLVVALFCNRPVGEVSPKLCADHRLLWRVRCPESYGIVGGKLGAVVTGVGGGKKQRKVSFRLCFAEESSRYRREEGIVYPIDGTEVVECQCGKDIPECYTLSCDVAVPEGVERIAPQAFYESGACAVALPSTLKSIGADAFARGRLREVLIPAGVEHIEPGAFSCISDQLSLRRASATCGPVKVDVDPKSSRYESKDGSLIEKNARGGRLLSLYYTGWDPKRPLRKNKAVELSLRFPKGIDSVAEASVVGPGLLKNHRVTIDFPDSLTTIEPGAFGAMTAGRIRIPAGLTHVAHDFWRLVVEEPSELYETDPEGGRKPRSAIPITADVELEVHPENPRYRVAYGELRIAPEDGEAPASDDVEAHAAEGDAGWLPTVAPWLGGERLSEMEKRAVEALEPGARVVIASVREPDSEGANETFAIVLDDFGELGYLQLKRGARDFAPDDLAATVRSVTPRSQLPGRAKSPLLEVELSAARQGSAAAAAAATA